MKNEKIASGLANYINDRFLIGLKIYGINSDFRRMYDSLIVRNYENKNKDIFIDFLDDWDVPRFLLENE